MKETDSSGKYLSKSSYMAGLKCPRQLWQLIWDRDSAGPDDGMSKLIKRFGIRFGELAHSLFPGAALIKIDRYKLKQAVEDTRKAIADGAEVVLEAAFCHGQCRVISDVVEKLDDGSWHLTEVKSSTSVKSEHIDDLAYQKWVMEQCGYPVSRCSVIFADKEGVWPELSSIFKKEDVTEKVNRAVLDVPGNLEAMLPILDPANPAPATVENFSKGACWDCVFKKTVCWKDVKGFTIHHLVNKPKIPGLKKLGVLYADDIPDNYLLADSYRKNVNRVRSKAIEVDRPAIDAMLNELEYPIHFLDFETVSVAVPPFDGTHPWDKMPFQYSLHILDADGTKTHHEYLHRDSTYPSIEMAQKLLDDVRGSGSIVVYHAAMEISVLNYLAEMMPRESGKFNEMVDRIWDLELIFKKYYKHWKFGSQSSIKVVLPVFCPELSYENLAIQEGGAASYEWLKLIKILEVGEEEVMASSEDLLEYCKRDTEAMVELLAAIRSVEV